MKLCSAAIPSTGTSTNWLSNRALHVERSSMDRFHTVRCILAFGCSCGPLIWRLFVGKQWQICRKCRTECRLQSTGTQSQAHFASIWPAFLLTFSTRKEPAMKKQAAFNEQSPCSSPKQTICRHLAATYWLSLGGKLVQEMPNDSAHFSIWLWQIFTFLERKRAHPDFFSLQVNLKKFRQ